MTPDEFKQLCGASLQNHSNDPIRAQWAVAYGLALIAEQIAEAPAFELISLMEKMARTLDSIAQHMPEDPP